MTAADTRDRLTALASPAAATATARFFKTGPGQYAEGDVFIGVSVPTLRTVARSFRGMPLDEVRSLLHSPVHEERHLALLVMVLQAAKGDEGHKERVFDLYLGNIRFVNNWDLVDSSAPQIVGGFLRTRPRTRLTELAGSTSLWERRIAVVATQHFVRHGEFGDTLAISRMLLADTEDLIHKAVGWTLREVGKKHQAVLEGFLGEHGAAMPRTMLRYSIERFPPDRRRAYLRMKANSASWAADGV